MLGFETLTLAPIDRNLVDPSLLDDDEIAWLDAYHAHVREVLTPLVDPDTAHWLADRHRSRSERNRPLIVVPAKAGTQGDSYNASSP